MERMGLFEKHRAKNDERIRGAASGALRPGENVVVQLGAMGHTSWWKFFLAIFPGVFLLEYAGQASYSPWAMGLAGGLWFTFKMRQYMLVLTDQRFLALRLRLLSSKKVDHTSECELNELRAEYERVVLNGKLVMGCGSTSQRFTVARAYEERAKELQTTIQGARRKLG